MKKHKEKSTFSYTKNYYCMWTDKNIKARMTLFDANKIFLSEVKKVLEESENWKNYSKVISNDNNLIQFEIFHNEFILAVEEFNPDTEPLGILYTVHKVEKDFDISLLKYKTSAIDSKFNFTVSSANGKLYFEKNKNSQEISNYTSLLNLLLLDIVK